MDNTSVLLTALMDTGNSLHDPLSDNPVIVAEFDIIKDFLPNDIRLLFYEKKENDFISIVSDLGNNFQKRIRMIPFKSVGKENGMLLGFRPDKIEINQENNIITLKEVVIGIYNFKLSKDNAYQGLLNPEIIVSCR